MNQNLSNSKLCHCRTLRHEMLSMQNETEKYYVQHLHSAGNMQERLARKFHLLHTKQANVQFGDWRPQFNAETSMPRHEDTTPVAPHPMPARTSPKCSCQDLQACRWREEFDALPPVRPHMAEIMHVRAALQTECPDQLS